MRIAGADIPENKKLEYGLTAIYGIGASLARKILKKQYLEYKKKVRRWI